ncbi:hypothetical protein DID78_06655 [Candidatus Marinamargulisbacteria bacterium SCGC AG-343-D04]|nr:hypothetical protein DID78_06655 [Candidatus Marinamargulisbacteria bacterium SCGC AG-343-D04]
MQTKNLFPAAPPTPTRPPQGRWAATTSLATKLTQSYGPTYTPSPLTVRNFQPIANPAIKRSIETPSPPGQSRPHKKTPKSDPTTTKRKKKAFIQAPSPELKAHHPASIPSPRINLDSLKPYQGILITIQENTGLRPFTITGSAARQLALGLPINELNDIDATMESGKSKEEFIAEHPKFTNIGPLDGIAGATIKLQNRGFTSIEIEGPEGYPSLDITIKHTGYESSVNYYSNFDDLTVTVTDIATQEHSLTSKSGKAPDEIRSEIRRNKYHPNTKNPDALLHYVRMHIEKGATVPSENLKALRAMVWNFLTDSPACQTKIDAYIYKHPSKTPDFAPKFAGTIYDFLGTAALFMDIIAHDNPDEEQALKIYTHLTTFMIVSPPTDLTPYPHYKPFINSIPISGLIKLFEKMPKSLSKKDLAQEIIFPRLPRKPRKLLLQLCSLLGINPSPETSNQELKTLIIQNCSI